MAIVPYWTLCAPTTYAAQSIGFKAGLGSKAVDRLGRVGNDFLEWSRPLPLCKNQRRESRLDGVDIQRRFRPFICLI